MKKKLTLQVGCSLPESNPPLHVNFNVSQMSLSGIKFGKLDIYGEVMLGFALFYNLEY